MMWGDGWNGAWAAIMIIVMVAVLALIVVGIVFLVRAFSASGNSGSAQRGEAYREGEQYRRPFQTGHSREAIEVLEERYARGEIDREEFLRRKEDILGSRSREG
ncbi:MAG: SHOCT domain-containing protein [Actinobacteria bacterium]|nr:SHOCT domain-containing protein [Actinomycetota bacterium]